MKSWTCVASGHYLMHCKYMLRSYHCCHLWLVFVNSWVSWHEQGWVLHSGRKDLGSPAQAKQHWQLISWEHLFPELAVYLSQLTSSEESLHLLTGCQLC